MAATTRRVVSTTKPANAVADDADLEDDHDEAEDQDATSATATPLRDRIESAKANRGQRRQKPEQPVIRLARNNYDPTEDWEVDHSGTYDPDGGPPKYDESPVPGGLILGHNYLHVNKDEIINSNGHEIDPDSTDVKGFAEVIDPDRYKDEDEDTSL